MTELDKAAREYVGFTFSTTNKGPCLVPKPGADCLITCHENDFCECEVTDGFRAGAAWALKSREAVDTDPYLEVNLRAVKDRLASETPVWIPPASIEQLVQLVESWKAKYIDARRSGYEEGLEEALKSERVLIGTCLKCGEQICNSDAMDLLRENTRLKEELNKDKAGDK